MRTFVSGDGLNPRVMFDTHGTGGGNPNWILSIKGFSMQTWVTASHIMGIVLEHILITRNSYVIFYLLNIVIQFHHILMSPLSLLAVYPRRGFHPLVLLWTVLLVFLPFNKREEHRQRGGGGCVNKILMYQPGLVPLAPAVTPWSEVCCAGPHCTSIIKTALCIHAAGRWLHLWSLPNCSL